FFDGSDFGFGDVYRREYAGAVARVDTGFFDVLHDAGDQDIFSVAEGVYVYFEGIFEETVDEYRAFLGEAYGFAHVAAYAVFVVYDHHGSSAEDVAGADQD